MWIFQKNPVLKPNLRFVLGDVTHKIQKYWVPSKEKPALRVLDAEADQVASLTPYFHVL